MGGGAARCRVGLCTLSADTVAQMPCNPAIGGTAKGHLVREIDALGGLMGRAIDATGIQFKLLNRSRGPAVWSPRAQADKRAYGAWMREALEARAEHRLDVRPRGPRCSSRAAAVAGLALEDGDACSCRRWSSRPERSSTVSCTSATNSAGRAAPANRRRSDLAESLEGVRASSGAGSRPGRRRGSIARASTSSRSRRAFQRRARRRADRAVLVSARARSSRRRSRVTCSTPTTRVHELVRAEHRRSPLYNGQIHRHRSAILPVARRQGDAVSRTGSGIRSSSSPRGWTSTRSTSTASR